MPGQGQSVPDSFKLEQFGGMLPAWDETIIPRGQGAFAENVYLFTGALAGWRKPKLLYTLLSGSSKFAYRLPTLSEAIANATIFMLLNPSDGFVVTLGEENYTFKTALTGAAYEVLIGATAADSVTNLFNAFTLDNGANIYAGTLYGVGTIANPDIDQSGPPTTNVLATDNPRIQVFAPSSGAAFNSTPVSTSNDTVAVWRYNGDTTTTFQGGENVSFDASITGDSTWIEFADPDTDVIRSPVVNDSFDRYYFASPSVAPKYNTRERIEAGLPAWFLGVPPPGCSPGVTVEGGGDELIIGSVNGPGGTDHNIGGNVVYLRPFTPTASISLDDLNFLIGPTPPSSGSLIGLLYDDSNGSPNSLLNVGTTVDLSAVTTDQEVQSVFTNPTGLIEGVQYWFGFATDATATWYADSPSGTAGYIKANTYGNGPPNTISGGTSGSVSLYMYGNATSQSVLQARSYVYTYETEYGEESAPSPATVESGWSNGTWTIELFQPPAPQRGGTRNITKLNLYRTITALSGTTTYYKLVELPIGTESYVDQISDDTLVSNDQLLSELWTPPPEDLIGFVSMPNGMIAGFRANEIWFCEPYRPHAWPSSYVMTTEYPIVGIGVTGNAVVACTSGSPYVAVGTSPGAMSAIKVAISEPCHSRGSIIGTNDGVFYTSPNGLILVTQYGAVTNTTELWITREKWQQLTPQKNLRSVFLASCYFSLGCVRNGDTSVAQEGFTCEISANNAQNYNMQPQPGGHRLGFSQLTGPNGFNVDNVRIDPWSSVCLVFQNGGVYYYDFADAEPEMQTYVWRSKKFQQRSKKNFQAMRFWFAIPEGTPALNATRLEEPKEDAVWESLPADRYGFVRVYSGNNVLVTCRELRVPQELLRIESGFKHETWWFEIEARVPISNMQVGTSVKAMART